MKPWLVYILSLYVKKIAMIDPAFQVPEEADPGEPEEGRNSEEQEEQDESAGRFSAAGQKAEAAASHAGEEVLKKYKETQNMIEYDRANVREAIKSVDEPFKTCLNEELEARISSDKQMQAMLKANGIDLSDWKPDTQSFHEALDGDGFNENQTEWLKKNGWADASDPNPDLNKKISFEEFQQNAIGKILTEMVKASELLRARAEYIEERPLERMMRERQANSTDPEVRNNAEDAAKQKKFWDSKRGKFIKITGGIALISIIQLADCMINADDAADEIRGCYVQGDLSTQQQKLNCTGDPIKAGTPAEAAMQKACDCGTDVTANPCGLTPADPKDCPLLNCTLPNGEKFQQTAKFMCGTPHNRVQNSYTYKTCGYVCGFSHLWRDQTQTWSNFFKSGLSGFSNIINFLMKYAVPIVIGIIGLMVLSTISSMFKK